VTVILPGAEWHPVPGHETTGPQLGGAPWRLVLHTTEGGTLESNLATYADGWFPHFTIDMAAGRIFQHLDMNEYATAVDHNSGWPFETNRLNCVQAEIIGFAAQIGSVPKSQLVWLGKKFIAPLARLRNIQLVAPPFLDYPDSYGSSAKCRMTPVQWVSFNGVCGHEHVPWNVHGDPGALDIATVLNAAAVALQPAVPPTPKPPAAPATATTTEDDELMIRTKTSKPNLTGTIQLDKGSKNLIMRNGARVQGDKATPFGFRIWSVPATQQLAGCFPVYAAGHYGDPRFLQAVVVQDVAGHDFKAIVAA
jgi:hypothetical protein